VKSRPAGNGFICEGARTLSYGPDDTGIVCGSGAGAFDIFDQGTHNQHAIRFHNAAGDLTRRVIYDQFSRFSNPLTGAAVPLHALAGRAQTAAVLGDLPTSSRAAVSRMADFFNKPVEQTP
jgi:hypothetical protein